MIKSKLDNKLELITSLIHAQFIIHTSLIISCDSKFNTTFFLSFLASQLLVSIQMKPFFSPKSMLFSTEMTDVRNVTVNGIIVQEQYFDWNSKQKGYVLSSFYYGYICTQVIGGVIAAKIGGNVVSRIVTRTS